RRAASRSTTPRDARHHRGAGSHARPKRAVHQRDAIPLTAGMADRARDQAPHHQSRPSHRRSRGMSLSSGPASLAGAMIERAILDAIGPQTLGCTGKDVVDARHFLISNLPEFRQARTSWCEVAGIDPDALRQYVISRLDGDHDDL